MEPPLHFHENSILKNLTIVIKPIRSCGQTASSQQLTIRDLSRLLADAWQCDLRSKDGQTFRRESRTLQTVRALSPRRFGIAQSHHHGAADAQSRRPRECAYFAGREILCSACIRGADRFGGDP